jgi:hypothetical protein
MRALGRLPHLQQLHYDHVPDLDNPDASNAITASSLLPSLRSLDLTDLHIQTALSDWDYAASNTLRTAMPHLSALTIFHDFSGEPQEVDASNPATNHCEMAALAQRTALWSLTLDLRWLSPQHHNLGSLSALQLRDLLVHADSELVETGRLDALMGAMAVQRTLTGLMIDGSDDTDTPELSDAGLDSLETLAGSLQRLYICAGVGVGGSRCFDVLARLSCLTKLEVVGCDAPDALACPQAVGQLSVLTALRVLRVDADAHMVKALLGCLAALSNLKQLGVFSYSPSAMDSDVLLGASLHRTLTHLGLCMGASLSGPGLQAILGDLTRIHHLELNNTPADPEDPHLHKSLLPLPPTLRVLQCKPAGAAARAAIQAAADRQDCVLMFGH